MQPNILGSVYYAGYANQLNLEYYLYLFFIPASDFNIGHDLLQGVQDYIPLENDSNAD
jgi:hypothetical protein